MFGKKFSEEYREKLRQAKLGRILPEKHRENIGKIYMAKTSTLISILVAVLMAVPTFSYALPVECYCVLYLREVMGVDIHGDADRQVANIPRTDVDSGDVVLLKYSNAYHVALVTKALTTGGEIWVSVTEANYHECAVDTRVIPLSDMHIRGIYRPTH